VRWLFLLVLSLNLAYIAWQINRPSADSYANVQPLKNVQPIILLSELKRSQNQSIKGGSQLTAPSIVEQEPSQQEVKVETATGEHARTTQELADQQKDSPVAVTDADEVAATEKKMPEPDEALQDRSPKTSACYSLGPFRDLAKLRGLTREIKSYVVTADFRGREEKEQPLYWVYIEPEKNYKKAIATGKRLKANKIKDFYIIREGEKINGISLGYFRNKDGANGLVKKVKKLGFNVALEPVFKTYTIYWLDYQLASENIIPEEVLNKYLQSTKKGKISRISRDCNG